MDTALFVLSAATSVIFLRQKKMTKEKVEEYETSWEPEIGDKIIQDLKSRQRQTQQQSERPYMISLVAIPGGGKSVSSNILKKHLDDRLGAGSTIIMPHDGYHIPVSGAPRR